MVKVVISLYERTKTQIKVGSGLTEELFMNIGEHKGSLLWSLLFAIASGDDKYHRNPANSDDEKETGTIPFSIFDM